MGRPSRDIKGQKFGFLTAIQYCGASMWLCKCDCNRYKEVRITDLEKGKTKSCGKCKLVTNKKPFEDLSGQTFNDWTVIDYAGEGLWNCVCSCTEGEENRPITKVRGYDLKNNKSKSCGHNEGKPKIDMTGKQCGEWTVLSYAGNKYWNCRCSCNREKKVLGKYLRNGVSQSCGHLYGGKQRINNE